MESPPLVPIGSTEDYDVDTGCATYGTATGLPWLITEESGVLLNEVVLLASTFQKGAIFVDASLNFHFGLECSIEATDGFETSFFHTR